MKKWVAEGRLSGSLAIRPSCDAKEKHTARSRPAIPKHVQNLLLLKQLENSRVFPTDIKNGVSRAAPTLSPVPRRKTGRACGKIILSGNTANRFGRRALAVPVDMHITAEWEQARATADTLRVLWPGHNEDGLWRVTVRKILRLIEARIGPLAGTVTIRSTLPLGKGMGSSTAIVIALARCFLGQNCKDEARAIEDVVNKGHSGLDFAAIWEERPVVVQNDRYEFTEVPEGLRRGFLIDTGLPVAPTPVIVARLKKRLPKQKALMDSVQTIGNCTERLLSGENPLTVFPDHYYGQVHLGVVPARVRWLIEKIQQSGGAAKAARFGGARGGAGMLFAIHPKTEVLKQIVGGEAISLIYDSSRHCFIKA
ncbi:MAG TPA: hypothetical protein VL754_15355 [Verrucomicrobiae bacterium]|jgi:hypothetical protein|nr:hypothetical protein [Verrucomicrobiae bacterium]